jgi:hypothetical protein
MILFLPIQMGRWPAGPEGSGAGLAMLAMLANLARNRLRFSWSNVGDDSSRGRIFFEAKARYLKTGAAWSSVGGAWMSILIVDGSIVDGASRK